MQSIDVGWSEGALAAAGGPGISCGAGLLPSERCQVQGQAMGGKCGILFQEPLGTGQVFSHLGLSMGK